MTALASAYRAPSTALFPRSAPAVAAATPSVGLRALTVYGVLLALGLQGNLPSLMRGTGAPGAVLMVLAHLPLYVAAARLGVAPFRDGPVRALAALVAALVPSLLWSEHPLDGAIKLAAIGTAIAWAALLSAWPGLVADVVRAGLAGCAASAVGAAAGLGFLPVPSSSFSLSVLFAAGIHWRATASAERLAARAGRSFALVALIGLVFMSTFRAPTIGALLVLGFFALRSREARVALAIAAIAGAVFFSVEGPRRAPSYAATVERNDLVGRYESISDDRLSGRGDIWAGILADASTSPRWLFVGGGLGDVDFIVAAANPGVMSFNLRGERVLSPHNLFLEVLIGAGIPGALALLWWLGSLASRLGSHPLDAGLLACTVVMCGSNVPLLDIGGGALFVALLCAHLGRREPIWRRGPLDDEAPRV
ncbi:MAG: O-antigen ligase family protein [Deltaproteobacteria bacterium]|nr:O-antigen ligase family protein [Myxococcales bacterium]MDP3217524.1 O-antigen ligase family protein [Deltaproteobacteria bacterium]